MKIQSKPVEMVFNFINFS